MGSLYFHCLFQKKGKRKKFHGIAGTCNRVCRVFQYLIWLRVKSIIIFFFFHFKYEASGTIFKNNNAKRFNCSPVVLNERTEKGPELVLYMAAISI